MDSAVPERRLAEANLLRVRGRLAEAKQSLLNLLAERPNDPETIDLLARTCEDAGDLEEAQRWRGIGGRVVPATQEESAAMPERREWPPLALGIVAVAVIVVLALASFMATRHTEREETPTLSGRVEAPRTTAGADSPVTSPSNETSGGTIATSPPVVATASEPKGQTRAEADGLGRLLTAEGGAARSLSVAHDPRTDTVTITFAPRTGETPRREAASLARTAFDTFATAKTLHLRALRGRDLVYLATAPRDRLATVQAESWARENEANPDALADALLTEEWNVPESSASNESLGGTP